MTVSLTINGTSYDYPQTGDLQWGPDATEWAQAVTSGMLQKAGGTFQLLADVNFGTTYGLVSQYYKTRTANIADAGQFRLARVDSIVWRNEANNANLALTVDASNGLLFNGAAIGNIITVSDTSTIDLTIVGYDLSADIVAGSITNAMINAAAAIAYSKLNLSNSILNADINATAGIVFTKMAALTASRVPVLDGSGFITASAVTATTLGYLDATSSIQTQLDAKQATGNYITALTGDVTASGPGSVAATIANSAVTNAKMANMANITFKGNISGGAAAPSDLSATQVTANLNVMTGAGGTGLKGLVPSQVGGDATKYLKGDGTWDTPAGAGDVQGPASSVAGQIARFADTSGKVLTATPATISNSDIDAAAAIARSKLASGNNYRVVTNGAAGVMEDAAAITAARALISDANGIPTHATTTATEIGYVNGVTSAIQTQLDAKQLRSVLTTKGDLYVATASNTTTRLGVGTNGYVLKADSAATEGVSYALPDNQAGTLVNCSIVASVAGNELTVAVKDSAGNNCSATSPLYAAFGNATLTNGALSIVSLTAALSITVPSTGTLGQRDGIASDIYVYLINSAGTIKIGICRLKLPEDRLYSSVAIGTGSDSSTVLYSDAIYSNIRVRCVGMITNTQATAGTWATAPSSIISGPRSLLPAQIIEVIVSANGAQSVSNDTLTTIQFNGVISDSMSLFNSGTYEILIPVTGCQVTCSLTAGLQATTTFNGTTETFTLYVSGTEGTRGFTLTVPTVGNADKYASTSTAYRGISGNTVKGQVDQNSGGALLLINSSGSNRLYVTMVIP